MIKRMRSPLVVLCAAALLSSRVVSSFTAPPSPSPAPGPPLSSQRTNANHATVRPRPTASPTRQYLFGPVYNGNKKSTKGQESANFEGKPATYDLMPGELGFGPEAIVRPLLKQTQLQNRKLQTVYDAGKHGWDARAFHTRVDAKGASVVLAKCRGQWIGGYNPRGWASLGGVRSSVASFLFYQKNPLGGWQKLRSRTGSMACGKDEFDAGIYFGADSLVIPLRGTNPKAVVSRLGYYFETGPGDKSTLLPIKGADSTISELYVVSGVYGKDEIIPNSGGVSELGYY